MDVVASEVMLGVVGVESMGIRRQASVAIELSKLSRRTSRRLKADEAFPSGMVSRSIMVKMGVEEHGSHFHGSLCTYRDGWAK